jgi:hypothetical protein
MCTSQTPFYTHLEDSFPVGFPLGLAQGGHSLSTFDEVPKLNYQSIKAQEYSAAKPEQAKPRPVEIFTEIITTQETGEYRGREFQSDNGNPEITGRAG